MKTIVYNGSSKIIKRIVHLLNRKAPLPLDGQGDAAWGTNGQVLTTDGQGNTYWGEGGGGGGDVTDVEVNGTSVVNAQGVAEVSVPTKTSDLNNDSGFIDGTDLSTALSDYTPTSGLAAVATSGSYNDLSNKPTIPAAQIQSDWNQSDTTAKDYIKNKPTIPTVTKTVYYGTCTGQAANQTKTVVVDSSQGFTPTAGIILLVKFDANNTYSATADAPIKLNVNSTGEINIYYGNSNAPTGTNTTAFGRTNYVNQYYYDGTNWIWSGSSADNNTTYSNMSASELTTGTATTARSISAKVLTDWLVAKLTNVAYKNVNNAFSTHQGIDAAGGTTSTVGTTYLTLGNNKAAGTDKNSKGSLQIYGQGSNYGLLQATNVTANRTVELPDASGTIALKDVDNNFSANQTLDSASGTTTTVGNSVLRIGNYIQAGNAGNSSGNILLCGNGSHHVQLYADTVTATRAIKLPDKSGTIALTSDISDTVSLTASGVSGAPSLQKGMYKRFGNLVVFYAEVVATNSSGTASPICTMPTSARQNENFIGCKNNVGNVTPEIYGFRIYGGNLYLNNLPSGTVFISVSGCYITNS